MYPPTRKRFSPGLLPALLRLKRGIQRPGALREEGQVDVKRVARLLRVGVSPVAAGEPKEGLGASPKRASAPSHRPWSSSAS